MAGLNLVQVIGNLGADPESKYTADGTAVTTMRVAASRNWTDPQGEKKEQTEWFSIVVWGKRAETVAQYLAKGRKVYVRGRLQTRSWHTQDGETKYRTEVVAEDVIFLDKAEGTVSGADYASARPTNVSASDVDADDLPFE
jgi:single-strand DNA-binding protein